MADDDLPARGPFTARSASDRTDDWPFWFVADKTGLNITVNAEPRLRGRLPFVPRDMAERIAGALNGRV